MTILSTSKTRGMLAKLIDSLALHGGAYVIGRRNRPEAILIPFPDAYRTGVSDSTLINANSTSFDFLADEPELYTESDVRE